MPYKALDLLVVRQMGALRSSVNTLPNGGGYSKLKAGVFRPRRPYSHYVSRLTSGASHPASHLSCPNGHSYALNVAEPHVRFSWRQVDFLSRAEALRRGECGIAASSRPVSLCLAEPAIFPSSVNLNS